jgi:hypothetical protein
MAGAILRIAFSEGVRIMTNAVKMFRRALIAGVAMSLPVTAMAAMDDNGVFIPSPEQQQYLGTTRTVVERADGAVIERTTTAYPPVTHYDAAPAQVAAPVAAPMAPQATQLDALQPATRGEPFPAQTPVNDELLQEHRIGDVTYITGGIGEAERRAMEKIRPQYNLRVTNAEKSGAFISEVIISLWNNKGEQLLSTAAEPIFFANLPAGSYTVKAEMNGQVKTQKVTVSAGKAAQVQFGWN